MNQDLNSQSDNKGQIQSPQPQQNPETSTQPLKPTVKIISINKGLPKVYIVEYLVFIIASAILVILSLVLFNGIIDSIGAKAKPSSFGSDWQYQSGIGMIASGLVFTPVLFWLSKRVHETEETEPIIKNHKWRKAFLGIFLTSLIIASLFSGVSLIQNSISFFANRGLYTDDAQPLVWKEIVTQLFSVVLLISTAFVYSQDFRFNSIEDLSKSKKKHHFSISVLVGVLVIIYAILPLRAQRNQFVDSVISSDLSQIVNQLMDSNKSVESVKDLEVSDKVKNRSDKYEYTVETKKNGRKLTYSVCAKFKTDTKHEDNKNDNSLLSRYGLSQNENQRSSSFYVNTKEHEKGKYCFDVNGSDDFEEDDYYKNYREKNNKLYEDSYEL